MGHFPLAAGVFNLKISEGGQERVSSFSHLSQSDPVKGVLLLLFLLGVVSNGNGEEVLWDSGVYACTRYINLISSSHIAYFFPSLWKTIEKKCI